MLKALKKIGLSLLSFAMVCSMLTFVPTHAEELPELGTLINTEEVDGTENDIHVEECSSQHANEPASNTLDYGRNTLWHSDWADTSVRLPISVTYDLVNSYDLTDIQFQPRNSDSINGDIFEFDLYVGDSVDEMYIIDHFVMNTTGTGTSEQLPDKDVFKRVNFAATGRYLKMVVTRAGSDNANKQGWFASMAEIRFYGTPYSAPADVNKAGLEAAIVDATDEYDTPDYWTEETYAEFKTVYEAAVALNENAEATQELVNNYINVLNYAKKNLEVYVRPLGTLINTSADTDITIEACDSIYTPEDQPGEKTLDYNANTLWHSDWSDSNVRLPLSITYDLAKSYHLTDIQYQARQDTSRNGDILEFDLYVGETVEDLALVERFRANTLGSGADAYLANKADFQRIVFDATGRYVKIVILDSACDNTADDDKYASMAEIRFYGTEKVDADKKELGLLIDLATTEIGYTNDLGHYSTNSFAPYEVALTNAQNVYEDDNATQDVVNEAYEALSTAIDGLVDIELLKENLEIANEYDTTEKSDTWKTAYASVLTLAQEALDNPDVDADTVDSMVALLDVAEVYADLSDAIAVAKATDTTGKTAESVEALNAAIATAETVRDSLTTDYSAYDTEIENLKVKLEELEDDVKFDKTALKAAIDEAKAIIEAEDYEGKYTDETATALEEAYSEALVVFEDDGSAYEEDEVNFQDYIDYATDTLNGAIDGLVLADEFEEVDREALLNLIDEYAEVYEGNNTDSTYVSATYEAFKAAYEAALAVADNEDATQAEVDDIVTSLANAVDELAEVADKTLLVQAINAANPIVTAGNEGIYTVASWDAFVAANEAAVAINAKEDATQEEVNNATNALVAAQEALVDLTLLKETIAQAETKVKDDYTEETWADFEVEFNVAKGVVANNEATKEEVAEAVNNLNNAMAQLEEKPAFDKTALKAAIDEAKAIIEAEDYEGKYSDETATVFEDAYYEAIAVYEDDGSSYEEDEVNFQEYIDNATNALNDAIDGLELADAIEEVDKEALVDLLDEYYDVYEANNADSTYVSATYEAFKAAYEAGNTVVDKIDATQAEVNEAVAALETAIEGLVETADKTLLVQAINAADPIITAGNDNVYTQDSWDAFVAANEAAVAINAKEDATQEEVDNATNALVAAQEALEEVVVDIPQAVVNVEARYSSNRVYWEAVEGATGYKVSRSDREDGDYTVLTTSAITATQYVDETAETGSQYFYKVTTITADGESESVPVQDVYATGLKAIHEHAKDQLHKDYTANMDFDGNRVETLSAEEVARVAAMNTGTVLLVFQPSSMATSTRQIIWNIKPSSTTTATGASDADNNPTNNISYMVLFGDGFRYDHGYGLRATFKDILQEGWNASAVQHATFTSGNNITHSYNGTTSNGFGSENWNGFVGKMTGIDTMTIGGAVNGGTNVAGFIGKIAYVTVTDEMLSQEELNEYTAAAIEAMNNFVEGVDKTALKAAIDQAVALGDVTIDEYTQESVEAFNVALSEANVIFNDDSEDVTQEAVDEATTNLLAAIQGLDRIEIEEVDKEALIDLLDEYAEIYEANNADSTYVSDTYEAFKAAYEAGVAVDEKLDATQTEVNEAVAALVAAIEGLEEVVVSGIDKSALQAAIERADALGEVTSDDYTVESVEAFDAAYSEAVVIFNDDSEDVTQEAVDEATTNLIAAIEGLTPVQIEEVDKEILLSLIEEAEEIIPNADDYTDETYAAFKAAYDAAVVVADNEDATQAEVDNAANALDAAMEALEEVVVSGIDKSALQAAIERADALGEVSTENYTVESVEAFDDAYSEAVVIFNDDSEDVTQEAVNEATANLIAAIEGLTPVQVDEVDKGALFALLEEAEEIIPNADDYTSETYDAFKAAYDAAVAVADNEDATQAEVDNAVTTLQTAMDALEIAVDKTALKALIDEVEALNGEDYSIKSWALATEALQAAKTVYENADATQEEVDAAKAELQAKKDALVDRSPLKPVLEEAEAKLAETDKYTPSTYNALKEVYESAKFLYDNAGVNYVQQDVYTHKDRVEAAIQALVEKANKEALQTLVNESKDAAENEDKYTAETWAPFKEAYDAALVVLANEEATQMEVDQATVVLRATKNALEEKPVEILDTKPLEDKIAEAKEFKEDEYYAPTYEALQTAIAAAEQALTTVTTNAQVAEEVAKLQAAIDALIARPARVTNLDAYAVNYKTIQIDWDAVEGATYYQIYRQNTQTGKWIKFKTSDTNSYTVTGVKTGVRYSYRVIANKVLEDGTVVAGKSSQTNSATALLEGEPVLTMKANGKTKFDLSWTKVDGATRYLVYRKSATEGWKKILTLGGNVTTYTTSSMVPNTYTFMIKAARYDSKDRTQTNGSNTCEGTSVFTKPVITVTKASSTSAKIAWKAVEGVKYYEVYRATSKSGTYSKLRTTTELSFTNKSLKAGKTYYYKVRAYRTYNNAKVYTSYSKVVSYTVK